MRKVFIDVRNKLRYFSFYEISKRSYLGLPYYKARAFDWTLVLGPLNILTRQFDDLLSEFKLSFKPFNNLVLLFNAGFVESQVIAQLYNCLIISYRLSF